MGPLAILGIQAAASVLQGIGGRADARKARKEAKKAVGYDLGKLVEQAEAAGFNPLTVLQATGAANYAKLPLPTVPSNAGILGGAIGQAASFLTDQQRFDATLGEQRREFDLERSDKLASWSRPVSGGFIGGGRVPDVAMPGLFNGVPMPEPGSPGAEAWAWTAYPVRKPSGSIAAVPQGLAWSMGWERGHWMSAQDVQDVHGEWFGEAEAGIGALGQSVYSPHDADVAWNRTYSGATKLPQNERPVVSLPEFDFNSIGGP